MTLLLAGPRPAAAQQAVQVRRSDLQDNVHLAATVVEINRDVIRLRAAIDGRVEDLDVSTGSVFAGGKALGHLANKEMAEILDSHSTTEQGVMEERWKQVYMPTPIECPSDCYVLRVFVKNKEWIKAKSLLLEAALEHKYQLVWRVRPEDAPWIRDGVELEYWASDDPTKRYKTHVSGFVLDIQGERANSGGSFTLTLPATRRYESGASWEGIALRWAKKDVLVVPTGAIIEYGGASYVPVKVTTGITTRELTQVYTGLSEKQDILVLEDADLKEATRHVWHDGEGIPLPQPEKKVEKAEKERSKPEPEPGHKIKSLPDPDATYGDDPYAQ